MEMSNKRDRDFSHLQDGLPVMVDVSAKSANRRTAVAEAVLWLGEAVMAGLQGSEIQSAKGPVFQTAIIAGTMATKQTSQLIPFCHPLPLEHCLIRMEAKGEKLHIRCEAVTTGKTGVEMEAMTGASVAALTVYDMCKSINKGIRIECIRLLQKTGGKSGTYLAGDE
jgi:cyclic pyranopterin monophosphate synthase